KIEPFSLSNSGLCNMITLIIKGYFYFDFKIFFKRVCMTIKKNNILFLSILCEILLGNTSVLQAVVYGKSFFVAPAFFRPASPEQIAALRYQLQVGEASK